MPEPKRIIITGASSGIGREIALQLASQNHALVLVARRVDLLLEVARLCLDRGAVKATVAGLDLSSTDQAEKLVSHLDELGTGELVLINNAGVGKFGDFVSMTLEEHTRQIQLNLIGLMAATHAVLPSMLSHGSGQIVNVLSIAATHVFPNAEAYAASKAGALALARSLSASYRTKGIRVTNILPGATDTPIWGTGGPDRSQMLSSEAVAQTVTEVVQLPSDRVVEEVVLTPPLGVL